MTGRWRLAAAAALAAVVTAAAGHDRNTALVALVVLAAAGGAALWPAGHLPALVLVGLLVEVAVADVGTSVAVRVASALALGVVAWALHGGYALAAVVVDRAGPPVALPPEVRRGYVRTAGVVLLLAAPGMLVVGVLVAALAAEPSLPAGAQAVLRTAGLLAAAALAAYPARGVLTGH